MTGADKLDLFESNPVCSDLIPSHPNPIQSHPIHIHRMARGKAQGDGKKGTHKLDVKLDKKGIVNVVGAQVRGFMVQGLA